MNYSFLLEAETEYLQAVGFFEERQPGLGAALIMEFESVMDLVSKKPRAWKTVHPGGIRRIGLKKFPFSVKLILPRSKGCADSLAVKYPG